MSLGQGFKDVLLPHDPGSGGTLARGTFRGMSRHGIRARPRRNYGGTLRVAAALFLVLNALPALAGQPPAPPLPRPARFLEPPPQAVEQGAARLHQACAAWLRRPVVADRDAPPSVAPERRVCAFVLDPGGQSADYMIKGGIVLAIVLIPAGLLIGAFWSALFLGARHGRSAVAWLSRSAVRTLSDVA